MLVLGLLLFTHYVGPEKCVLFERHFTHAAVYVHIYRKTSNISRTLVGNKIVDNSDVVGASSVGAAPTTSSFST